MIVIPLRLRPEAELDLLEAAVWYDNEQLGLGDEFLLSVRRTWEPLMRNLLLASLILLSGCTDPTKESPIRIRRGRRHCRGAGDGARGSGMTVMC